ncbi:MAG: D-2-hydroxyacid dehydrogenase family protein [Alphaproteobacteria bacterium]
MARIAVLDDYQGIALDMADWSALAAEHAITVFRDHLPDEAALAERLRPFDIVCLMRERTPMRRTLIDALPSLRLIVTTGPRNASIDMAAAKARGITVCATGHAIQGTSELTWGLIIALARKIALEDRAIREGRWQSTVGIDLQGKTLGVMGLGRLGSRVAKVGLAFGMTVIAWSQSLTRERAAEHGATLVGKDDLLRQADVLSIHLVLGDRSRGLIGAREFDLMKRSALLVNTSRGPIVDEAALIQAIRTRRIAGAALDVFDIEPLPADHPLRNLPNTVTTPHLGYVTEAAYRTFFGDMVEDIGAFLAGKPVRVIDE